MAPESGSRHLAARAAAEFAKGDLANEIQLIRQRIPRAELVELARRQFGDMVKAVVDVQREIMAIGGELHSDEEAVLLDDGSKQAHLWGINLYPEEAGPDWIEFDSMINVRPAQGNRSRTVEDAELQKTIRRVVHSLVGES
ncbi:MAG TPA: DUF5674 family protein [Longimicrobiales bacterium]|nr:DUF5674 family protein [Longimicrobiales bacterium]